MVVVLWTKLDLLMRGFCFALLALTLVGLLHTPACAQSGDHRCFPNGAQRGTTVTLTFPAMASEESAALVVEGDGVKAAGPFVKGVGSVIVAADAAPGMRQVRLVGAKTATTPRPFLIGTLPVVLDREVADKKLANDRLEQAQAIEQLPVVVNGSLGKSQDIDVYRVKLKKGDCLVAASESRLIAAPTNLGLYVRDLSGTTVPVQLDYRKRDPLYTCVIPADGEYQLQFFEVTNNMGDVGEQTLYRVTLTTGPWLDYVMPPGAQRGATTRLTGHGWNLDGKAGPGSVTGEVAVPAEAGALFPVSLGGASNTISVAVGDQPAAAEVEPNNKPDQAQPLTLPAAVEGTFAERGDTDCFRITLKAKEVLSLRVEARELDSYADVTLRLQDPAGKTVLSEDDEQASRDPRAFWTCPADGTYTVVLRDIGSRGGPAHFYRLHAAVATPQLRVIAREAAFVVKPGAKLDLPVTVFQAYQPGEISLSVEGLPAGVTAEVVKVNASPNRENQQQTKLVLTAAADAKPGYAAVRVIATTAGDRPLIAIATWALTGDGGWRYGTGFTERLVVLVPAP
jgi:hypothetical protein